MKSDTINELIDSFRDTLINRTDFNPGQVHTAATLLRTILAEPTPEKPPITRPATAESICEAFEDYVLHAKKFSRMEVEVLLEMVSSNGIPARIPELMTDREWKEFLNKLS